MTDSPAPLVAPSAAPPRARRLRTGRTIAALILREMSTTYGRSPGGYVWAVLQPIGAIMILSLAFSLLLRAPSLGTSFLLFYATGYIPFALYGAIATKAGRAIRFSRALLAYPGVTWLDAVLARFLLTLLTQLTVACLIFGGILASIETRTLLDYPAILGGLALAAFVGLGVGTLNCFLMTRFPLWEQAWAIVTRPLFLASGLFYILEDLPPAAREILWWNPLIHVTGLTRTGFYPTYEASYVSVPYVCATAALALAAGLMLLRRNIQDLLAQQ